MSRSHRRTPIIGMTTAESEKADKVAWHRRFRARVRAALARAAEDMPHHYEVSDPWTMAKDGRQWISRATPPVWRKAWMRK